MFSNCPFHSLLEIVQQLWFWVEIEKVIEENIRTKQNKNMRNLSKYLILWFWLWSSLAWDRIHLGRFGLLMGCLWTSCGPRVTYRPPIRPLWLLVAQNGSYARPRRIIHKIIQLNIYLNFVNFYFALSSCFPV